VANSQADPPQQGQPDQTDRRGRRGSSGIVIARPFGIPVHISPYWIVIAAVYVIWYASIFGGSVSGGAKYLLAVACVILLYLSVLVHELSHSLVARGYGLPVRRILLYPLGGVSEIEKEPQTPLREFCVSAAGPALSLVLAVAGFGLFQVFRTGWSGELVWAVMWVNLIVGVFNFLPGLPLDGGRMLRAVIWKITGRPATATIAAAWAGRGLAVALVVASFTPWFSDLFDNTMFSAFMLVAVAAFMWIGAGQSIRATKFRERLPELQARRLARRAISVSADTPLAEAVRRADESRARAVVIVDHESKPIAIVNEAAVMATPPQRRPWIEAGTVARSIEPNLILPADISGMALLEAIKRAPASEYLLVEQSGQVYGVLAARDMDHVFAGV
jgi:Zn-dependent protease/CBS domain-containing protein